MKPQIHMTNGAVNPLGIHLASYCQAADVWSQLHEALKGGLEMADQQPKPPEKWKAMDIWMWMRSMSQSTPEMDGKKMKNACCFWCSNWIYLNSWCSSKHAHPVPVTAGSRSRWSSTSYGSYGNGSKFQAVITQYSRREKNIWGTNSHPDHCHDICCSIRSNPRIQHPDAEPHWVPKPWDPHWNPHYEVPPDGMPGGKMLLKTGIKKDLQPPWVPRNLNMLHHVAVGKMHLTGL